VLLLQKLGNIDDDLKDLDVSVKDEPILTQDTKDGLKKLGNSSVDNINFEQFFNEVYLIFIKGTVQPFE
jgi:hypothetical protein